MEEKSVLAAEPTKKMTYEELEQVAHSLGEQNQMLYGKLKELNMANVFKRMDYLFKVVELKEAFTSDFVVGAVEELEKLLTLEPEEEKKE